MEKGRSDLQILAGKPTGEIPLGNPRNKWEDTIKINLSFTTM